MKRRLDILTVRIKQLVCQYLHKQYHKRLPLYKQGTYEVIGEAVFCLKCIKEGK